MAGGWSLPLVLLNSRPYWPPKSALDRWQIGAGEGEKQLHAGLAGRHFGIGVEAVDHRLRPWLNAPGVGSRQVSRSTPQTRSSPIWPSTRPTPSARIFAAHSAASSCVAQVDASSALAFVPSWGCTAISLACRRASPSSSQPRPGEGERGEGDDRLRGHDALRITSIRPAHVHVRVAHRSRSLTVLRMPCRSHRRVPRRLSRRSLQAVCAPREGRRGRP